MIAALQDHLVFMRLQQVAACMVLMRMKTDIGYPFTRGISPALVQQQVAYFMEFQ